MLTIKTVAELRNIDDAAYTMSHAAQRTQRLVAGRGADGYQVTNIQLAAATYIRPSTGRTVRRAGLASYGRPMK